MIGMKQSYLITVVWLVAAPYVCAQDENDRHTTVQFLKSLQLEDGSFRAAVKKPSDSSSSSLRASLSAIRALRYFGGEVPNKAACAKFVASCFDPANGGFADTPKGKPEVFTTAIGLMAVVELNMPVEKYGPAASNYLATNARTFDDIRIAIAGLEAIKQRPTALDHWLAATRKGQTSDGSFGAGLGQARETGSRVVTLLRLGVKVENQAAILKILKEGQRNNGGYGKADSELASDLETTYRVMRCFNMLKALPDNVEGVRSFVAKCRNEDGGYGVSPGQTSTVSGTYFAAIILHWLDKK